MTKISINSETTLDLVRIGEISVSDKKYSGNRPVAYQYALKIDYDDDLPKGFVNRHIAFAYFFIIDGEIYKIGQSECKGGIRGCMNFYLKSGQDDPSITRFAINSMIRKELQKGKCVEVYVKCIEPIQIEIPTLNGMIIENVVAGGKSMEENMVKEFKKIKGEYPIWNMQESGNSVPSDIASKYAEYILERKTV
tara:strand:- start:945 stop:1526 length:582 start_codon:yes stop_codon:yes gene_type:complete